ncbi:hypothetical protein [Stratiformator vulcanicus]|uniref:Cytochrome C n=1 Tax=Stratiformator vulcanicus TaxID=2527980 RepID=A0A517R3V3_9PLAN|nr:hypothetical protein [Stratiformator vulcanicus]QDT38554.1 hypothetical protein Pan189_29490 [Stratiformator vulcanicus]
MASSFAAGQRRPLRHLLMMSLLPIVAIANGGAAESVSGVSHDIARLDSEFLPNAIRVHPRVISGGTPDGSNAFAELRTMGVRTLISVDGMTPDVESAKKYGLRYVHLPHGYDGIADDRFKSLAKGVRTLPGPIYIHCHHGKHRSPAAAAAGCVGAGLISKDEAEELLKLAGTGKNYKGLFAVVHKAEPLDEDEIDAIPADFPETTEIAPMAEAMVKIAQAFHNLERLQASGWKAPADHPDLDAVHEALLLREHYTEMLRTDDARSRPKRFYQILAEGRDLAQRLEVELDEHRASAAQPRSGERLLTALGNNCKACHVKFRDNAFAD